MFVEITQLFAVPAYEDKEQRQVAIWLTSILLIVLLLGAVMSLVFSILGDPGSSILCLSSSAFCLALLVLARRGHVHLASRLLILTLLGLTTLSAWTTEGLNAGAISTYFFVLAITALLRGGTDVLILVSLSIVAVWGLFFGELRTAGRGHGQTELFIKSLILSLMLGLTAVSLRFAIGRLNRALEHTRRDARALAQANSKLRSEIDDRVRAEQALSRRNRELELLSRAVRAFSSTLDLDQVLIKVLDQACHLLEAEAASVWLVQAETGAGQEGSGELVCRQAVGPGREKIRGWRLGWGEGNVGWVACHGQSIIVHDTRADVRYVREVGQHVGLELRSILSVPMQIREDVIGVLQVAATTAGRFDQTQLTPFESLASAAAFAIENARLYGQANQEISERARAEAALKTYAIQLEHSNRELQNFLHVASHDLQEPLRKVQTLGDRLQTRWADGLDERNRDYLTRMQRGAARMQALINALLTYSRVTSNAQQFRPVDLAQVALEVVSDQQAHIQRVDGQVEIGNLPTIKADPVQMQQLLHNLIDNALRFHRKDEAPVVKVQAQLLNGDLEHPVADASEATLCQITVVDNGIGFDQKYVDRIFQVFQRLHGRSEHEGTGIGLATCRKIVERHGGEITATSAPGQGATFFVTLPMRQSEAENQT
jgi:signal transduction histidine kinase